MKFLFLHFLALLLGLTGCFSLSTFQSPQVLEPGQKSLGFGVSGFYIESEDVSGIIEFDIFGRYGLANRLDGGIKIFGLPAIAGGIQGDLKYQVLKDPFFLSFDLASFYATIPTLFDEDENINTFGITPLILVGNRTFYGGAKIYSISRFDKIDLFGSISKLRATESMPALVLGATLGKNAKIIPEVNIYFFGGETVLIFGIGLQGKSPSKK